MAPKDGRKAFVRVYTDEVTVAWEERIEWHVRDQLGWLSRSVDDGDVTLPFRQRVVMALRFNLLKPASTSKAVLYPVRARSDVDNLGKAVLDALQKVGVLSNDNIVTDLNTIKRYAGDGHPEGVEIDVTGVF